MNYIRLPHMDNPVSIFAICQAHQQLESDYNLGGWLRERASNQRRRESTSCQLRRMGYRSPYGWVDICSEDADDPDDDDVRDIYLHNVLKMGLPVDDEMYAFMQKRYVKSYLDQFQIRRSA